MEGLLGEFSSFYTDAVSARDRGIGKVREPEGVISASMGAMRPLVAKLDKLLLPPPQGCSSKEVKAGMRLLREDVEKISSYLDKLSEVEDPPPTAKRWMNEARDLSYKMEDYINGLIFVQPEDPSLVPNNINTTRFFHKFSSHVKTPKTKVIIAEKLPEFRMYVQEAIERHRRYNLHFCSTLRHRFVSFGPMLLPTRHEGTADIVIDDRMNEFINSLANDGDQQLKVLSVLGSACLGKTTIARVFYDRFGKQYSCRAFIRVSKKPDMKRIFRDMLSQLQRQDLPQDCDEIVIINNIKKYLQDKRYLIILDDVWAASVWDIINHAFPDSSHGSRIITTTQIEDVALTCCYYQSEHVFEMKPLDDNHSRKLFYNIIFCSESDCPEEFKEILNEIVEIVGGLPLAIIIIASLIASQPAITIDLLTYIRQSLSSFFSANPTSERTRQVLNLSFNNLPQYLKTCLLYLSMYQEGYTFCKHDLVKQWMAEGFIDTTEGQDMNKVAESYLHQLIGRRFIQPIRIKYNNEVLSCAVHDAVHDHIARKSAEENFIVAIDYSQKDVALSHKVRRLSLLFGDARHAKTPANIRKSQVRSLSYSGLFNCMPCIRGFKSLRVLNLQVSCHGGSDDPVDLTGISELFQLRYLKVACDVCIKLPNHGLQCLETLDIMDVISVPWDLHLPQLLHLSLPVERNLLNWFVSQVSHGKLNYLQDLHLTSSSTLPSSEHLERSMQVMGSLLAGHGNLETLALAHDGSCHKNVAGVIISWDGLLTPPPLLQRFECSPHSFCIFSRIPKWIGQLANLCILKIAVQELPMDGVDILRGLPALTALSLYVQTAPIESIVFDKAGFALINYFKFRCSVPWLKFEKGAMPNLWKLKLSFNAISPRMGQYQHGTAVISIEHMPGLKEISAKIGAAATDADAVSALRTLVCNHPSNPTISVHPVDYCLYGDETTKERQEPENEILEEEPDEYGKRVERLADKRISRSPESSWCPHAPESLAGAGLRASFGAEVGASSFSKQIEARPGAGMVFKTRLGCFAWVQAEPQPCRTINLRPDDLSRMLATTRLHAFTLDELKSITENFSSPNFLREDSFGPVYQASIDGNLRPGLVPQEVTIQFLDLDNNGVQGRREWLTEVLYVGTLSHPLLVKLVGFCIEDDHRMLVYEYMPCGSLEDHLLKRNQSMRDLRATLPWSTRLKIGVGAAKGLVFLHEADMPVIYCDFKASNILLGLDHTVKLLPDFGLVKRGVGTRGRYNSSMKGDVYNFGVVLLELLAGRSSVGDAQLGRQKNLVKWSRPYLRHEDKLHRIMDPSLEGQYLLSAAWSTAKVARRCLESVPEDRPSMRDVVKALALLLEDKHGIAGADQLPKPTEQVDLYKRPFGNWDDI